MSFQIDNLTYAYPPRNGDVAANGDSKVVFRDFTLEIPFGTTIAVLGPSGVGKSTLLYLLGLLWDGEPKAGTIRYTEEGGEPHSYSDLSDAKRASLRLREFGFALQSSYLLSNFTCLDNVAMPLALRGEILETRRVKARALIDAAGDPELSASCDRLPDHISGGQRQRFAVLRALVHSPRVVFADEPFSNLDEANTEKVLELLRRWRMGDPARSLILVCHDIDIAYAEATDFILLGRSGQPIEGRKFTRGEFSNAEALRRRLTQG